MKSYLKILSITYFIENTNLLLTSDIVEKVIKTTHIVSQRNEWQIDEDLVLKKEKIYILKDKELRAEIIQLYHDILVAEHGRR